MQELRFAFGTNWASFLACLTSDRIASAQQSLSEMLGREGLVGQRFLDVGSGSGLFSLAARRMGASVVSFDYDRESVACTAALRERFDTGDQAWRIERGSVLDADFLSGLGRFDIVYAWGVLHHTGDMWRALDLVSSSVSSGGRLYLAIYNRRGPLRSAVTVAMKLTYVHVPRPAQWLLARIYWIYATTVVAAGELLHLRNPMRWFRDYGCKSRGMSWWHDIVDWVGGYPFETASPDEVFNFLHQRQCLLESLRTVGTSHGCGQSVFRRSDT